MTRCFVEIPRHNHRNLDEEKPGPSSGAAGLLASLHLSGYDYTLESGNAKRIYSFHTSGLERSRKSFLKVDSVDGELPVAHLIRGYLDEPSSENLVPHPLYHGSIDLLYDIFSSVLDNNSRISAFNIQGGNTNAAFVSKVSSLVV